MSLTTTPVRAFLEAVILEPDEDVHRLVFADWLEEHDDPRGEFIRLQCELERLSENDPRRPGHAAREQELRLRHGREWAGKLARIVSSFSFRRGFVERVRIDGKLLLEQAASLFRLAPIRELELSAGADEVARLAEEPLLSRLTALDLTFHGQNGASLADFLDSPHLTGLTRLRIRASGTSAAAALRRARHLFGVTDLDLAGISDGGVYGIMALARSSSLKNLVRLRLSHSGLGDDAVRLLAAAPLIGTLTSLDLRYNELGSEAAEALAASPLVANLATLALGYNRVGDRGVAALAESTRLPSLTRLYLSRNGLEGRGVKVLANAAERAGLTHLDLDYNDLSTEALSELARSPALRHLQTLFVRCGPGMTDVARALLVRRFGARTCKF